MDYHYNNTVDSLIFHMEHVVLVFGLMQHVQHVRCFLLVNFQLLSFGCFILSFDA